MMDNLVIVVKVRGLTDKNNLFYHPGEEDKDCEPESPSRLSAFDTKDREGDQTMMLGDRRSRVDHHHPNFPEIMKQNIRDHHDRESSVTPVEPNLLPTLSNNNNNSNLINNNNPTPNNNNNKRRRKNSLNCDNTTTIHGANVQERHYSQDSQVSEFKVLLNIFIFSKISIERNNFLIGYLINWN